MSKNSDPEVPFTTETITECICPQCPVQGNSQCVKEKMEKLPEIMKTADRGRVPESRDVPEVYCSTAYYFCKNGRAG